MEQDSKRMRGDGPFVFANLREGTGLDEVEEFIEGERMLSPP